MNLNKKYSDLAILVICFLALRFSILLTDVKHIEMNEETVCGVLANDVISKNIRLPIFGYQHVEWCGDTLVVGFLAIPFLSIFGQSIIVLKLIPLLFSLGTFIIWFLFLDKYSNRTVAILTSLLFIVSPPYYTRLGLIAAIPHTELNFFTIAAIFLFFKNLHKPNMPSLVFFGLLSGLGIYCHYLFLITLATCLLFWYLWDKGFIFRKSFLIFLLSFLIGLIPWIISNIYTFPSGLPIVKGHFNLFLQLRKLFRLIVYNIPHSFGFDYLGDAGMKFQSGIYYIIFVFLFISLLIQYRKSLLNLFTSILPTRKLMIQSKESLATLFILIFPLLYISFFTINTFYDVLPIVVAPQGTYDFTTPPYKIYRYRYLVPLYPFVFAIISLGINELLLKPKKGVNKFLTCSVICYLLVLGLYSNCRLISSNKYGQGFIYKGYRQWEYARDITSQDWSFKKIAASIGELEGESKFRGLRLLGERMANKYRDNISPAIKKIEGVSPVYHHSLYFGLSSRLAAIYRKDQKKVIRLINEVPNKSKHFCFEGYGFALGYRLLKSRWNAYDYVQSLSATEKFLYKELTKRWKEPRWDISQYINSTNEIEEKYRPFCYIGLGRFLAREEAKANIARCIRTINKVDEKFKTFCYIGFGQEMGELFNNFNMNLFPFGQIPKPFQKFFFEEIDLNLNTFRYYSDKIGEHFRPYVYEGLGLAIRKNIEDEVAIDYLLGKIDSHYKNNFSKGFKGGSRFYNRILQSKVVRN